MSKTIFQPALTPYNSREKGYDFIGDVIYDLLNPNEEMKDIIEMAREFSCKLGTPSSTNCLDPYFGLYLPIY